MANHTQSSVSSLGGPYGLLGASSGTINDHYLFFRQSWNSKKSWWFQRHVLNFTWKTVCSNFLNWKPKRGYLFLNGHNDQTWPSRHIIGFSFFQNCTHFSICRNFKETYYCMQFSPLFVCLFWLPILAIFWLLLLCAKIAVSVHTAAQPF